MSLTEPTNSGIVTDESGERHIPESLRADGSKRKRIRIRPGFQPLEDVAVYRNRSAQAFRDRTSGFGAVPGAEGLRDGAAAGSTTTDSASSAASIKNAKRREARKKAKAAAPTTDSTAATTVAATTTAAADSVHGTCDGLNGDPAGEAGASKIVLFAEVATDAGRDKKARSLRKKLKQARELKTRKEEDGEVLLPEQIAKVIKIGELIRELEALGLGPDGEVEADGAVKDGSADENDGGVNGGNKAKVDEVENGSRLQNARGQDRDKQDYLRYPFGIKTTIKVPVTVDDAVRDWP